MAEQQDVEEMGASETSVLVGVLAEGAAKILDNASDLQREAVLLHAAGALSRSLALHQISLEECSKVDMLGAWASGKLMGYEGPDLDGMAKIFANHRAKNYNNAYMMPPDDAELSAREEGASGEALRAFKAMQAEFHAQSNVAKNASLYVDLKNGEFTAPKERITEEMVGDIAALNERFLGQAELMVRMLFRWSENPRVVNELFSWLEPRLKELKPSEDGDALASFLDELFQRAKASEYAEAMGRAPKRSE